MKKQNKKTTKSRSKTRAKRTVKKTEYVICNSLGAIIVKFNREQLVAMTNALDKSGAREIGVSVQPL